MSTSTLTFRPATREDCEQVVQLINACSRVLRGADEITVEGLHSEWEQPGFDLATDTLAAITANGAIVGYADIFDMEEPPVKPLVFGRVHPNYEGRGIGTHLMQWAEIRSRQAIDRVPPGIRVAMKGSTLNRHRPSLQLLQDMGMVPVRYTLEMDIALDTPPVAAQWPAGIAVYTHVEPGDDLAIYRAYREAWQDHRDSVSRSEAQDFPLWQHNMTTDPNYDPSLWFLAREGNEIAAIALCKRLPEEDPQLGWIETLAVRRPWRRRGLGLALLYHAFGEFYRRGLRRAGLHVDASSLTGATRLYERAGMSRREVYVILEKELRPGVELSTQSL